MLHDLGPGSSSRAPLLLYARPPDRKKPARHGACLVLVFRSIHPSRFWMREVSIAGESPLLGRVDAEVRVWSSVNVVAEAVAQSCRVARR